MSGDKTQQQLDRVSSDEEMLSHMGWLTTVDRGFFQILRDDMRWLFRRRKKRRGRR